MSGSGSKKCPIVRYTTLSDKDQNAIDATFKDPFSENTIIPELFDLDIDHKQKKIGLARLRKVMIAFMKKTNGAKFKKHKAIDKLFEFIRENGGTDIKMDHRALDTISHCFPSKIGCFDTSLIGGLMKHCKTTFSHEDDTRFNISKQLYQKKIKVLIQYLHIILHKIMDAFVAAINKQTGLSFPTQSGGDNDNDTYQFNSETYASLKRRMIEINTAFRDIDIDFILYKLVPTMSIGIGEIFIGIILVILSLWLVSAVIEISFGILFDIGKIIYIILFSWETIFEGVKHVTRKVKEKIKETLEKQRFRRLQRLEPVDTYVLNTSTIVTPNTSPNVNSNTSKSVKILQNPIPTEDPPYHPEKFTNYIKKLYVKHNDKYVNATDYDIYNFVKDTQTLYIMNNTTIINRRGKTLDNINTVNDTQTLNNQNDKLQFVGVVKYQPIYDEIKLLYPDNNITRTQLQTEIDKIVDYYDRNTPVLKVESFIDSKIVNPVMNILLENSYIEKNGIAIKVNTLEKDITDKDDGLFIYKNGKKIELKTVADKFKEYADYYVKTEQDSYKHAEDADIFRFIYDDADLYVRDSSNPEFTKVENPFPNVTREVPIKLSMSTIGRIKGLFSRRNKINPIQEEEVVGGKTKHKRTMRRKRRI
jgi:hypothetical protein